MEYQIKYDELEINLRNELRNEQNKSKQTKEALYLYAKDTAIAAKEKRIKRLKIICNTIFISLILSLVTFMIINLVLDASFNKSLIYKIVGIIATILMVIGSISTFKHDWGFVNKLIKSNGQKRYDTVYEEELKKMSSILGNK
jgi:hypothetical protein